MAVDKALNAAPLGLGIALLTPDKSSDEANTVMLEDGGAEVTLGPDEEDESVDGEGDFAENLAETLDESVLTTLAGGLLGEIDSDLASRKDWINTYVDGLELLGLKIEERTEPWEGACGVYHPLLSEALVKFQADAMTETFPAQGPVKTQIIGKETTEKLEAALRVKDDMNYQLTERMVEYRPEHERMLWGLGLAGNAFKKVYYDPSLRRQTAIFCPAEDIVVPYGASSLETSPRVTHVMRKTANELVKLQNSGFYRDVDLGEPVTDLEEVEKKIAEKMGFSATADDRYRLYEVHVDLDLKGYEDKDEKGDPTGIGLPYVVTIEKGTHTVLAVRRNWHPEDKYKKKRNHFVHYAYIPGFGFYAFGLIHLIGAFAKSGTSIIRQLVDAGTLSNLPGGFKTKGLRIKGDDTPIAPGEFRDVDVASGTLRDNILPLPYKEPSQTLYSLLNTIVDEGRRFASAADLKISDMSAQSPVGTTLAILERTLKVMTAVQARVHYAMRQEFRLIRDIIRDYTPDDYDYDPEDGTRRAKKRDYELVEVIPVSDPNAATMAQKVMQYQAALQLSQGAPQIYDMPYLHRQMLDVLGIKNASKIIPLDDDQKPRDPVSENMAVLRGKPVKAFPTQDHEAHIVVHTSAVQDPEIAKLMGQNPQAQGMMMAMQAHIAEHLAFAYRKRIEDAAGVPYPAPDAEMPPDMEVQISRLAAAAAQQVLQDSQQKAAAEQAQQMAQDPIVQMQQAELKLKQDELALKKMKLAIDASADRDRIQNEKDRIAATERVAGMNAGVKIATDKANLSAKQQEAGLRIGVDAASEAARQKLQDEASRRQHDIAKANMSQQKEAKPNEQS